MSIVIGYGNWGMQLGPRESFMRAEEEAYGNIKDGVEEWLEENIKGQYEINPIHVLNDMAEVLLSIKFKNEEAAMAYKLRWE